jgi:hypothetical protein
MPHFITQKSPLAIGKLLNFWKVPQTWYPPGEDKVYDRYTLERAKTDMAGAGG